MDHYVARSEASPSDPQSCPVMGHWKGLWASLLYFHCCYFEPLSSSLSCSVAFGLKLGVRGLGTGGHASVTQARDTLNLGVVTYYHPFFTSGV